MATTFFSDLLTSITERGRTMLRLGDAPLDQTTLMSGLVELCEQVLSGRGEASGAALARAALDRYEKLDDEARSRFFSALADKFGPDPKRLTAAVHAWIHNPSQDTAADLHFQAEARRQELLRRLNRAPGGTAVLVKMREDLLRSIPKNPALKQIDRDFSHLLSSWFNRGFLELRRIDWSSPAMVLEKIIRYEAVHQIAGWDDLRRRINPSDRRCYAFFHPALADDPLIFVEVALTPDIPGAIQPLLAEKRDMVDPDKARTAVFYSISNCQEGLAGISFGNFLIKQVVEELRRELPKLENFVTLSPVPGFMRWLTGSASAHVSDSERKLLAHLNDTEWTEDENVSAEMEPLLRELAAIYFLEARAGNGRARDPVARFHLGNGARLERINWMGDKSEKGLRELAGIMVNYHYDLNAIEDNHEAYANKGEIVASGPVRKLIRGNHKALIAALAMPTTSEAPKSVATESKAATPETAVIKPADATIRPEPAKPQAEADKAKAG